MTQEKAWRGKELAAQLTESGELKTTVMERGPLKVVFIRPDIEKTDIHQRDEVYIVTSGSIGLKVGGVDQTLNTGDAAFVPAGSEHTFHGLSDDVQLWSVRTTPN